jgi:hypothetical protein
MNETLDEQLEELVDEARYKISGIQVDLQNLVGWLDKQMDLRERHRKEATDEAFDLLVRSGFNVGTIFEYGPEKTVWKITGINCEGFRCETVMNGETRKTNLPASNKSQIEKYLPHLKIVRVDAAFSLWHGTDEMPALDEENRVKLVIIRGDGEKWQIERSVFSVSGDWNWEVFVEDNHVLRWTYAESFFKSTQRESEAGK